jgi:hypothetical protein
VAVAVAVAVTAADAVAVICENAISMSNESR